MSQHDYSLANANGASFRADVNSALAAIVTRNSGATEPSATFSGMAWFDTTTGTKKRRNQANSGWIVEGTIDETFILSRSSNTMLDISDRGKAIFATSTFTQTLDAAATLGDGWFVAYKNEGSGVITFDPNSSETIDGATTLSMPSGASCLIYCNGITFKTVSLTGFLVSSDAGASEGPVFELYRDSASPAASDVLGLIRFNGKDSAGNKTSYGSIYQFLSDATNGSEDGAIIIQTIAGGALADRWLFGQGFFYSGGSDPGLGLINATGYNVAGNSSGPATQANQETATDAHRWVTPSVQQHHPSSAKAIVSFIGTGVVTIGHSYNVSSITDNGTGDYTIHFTIPFSSTSYSMSGISNVDGGALDRIGVVGMVALTTSSCRVRIGSVGTGGTVPQDRGYVSLAFFGDQ